jgi:serine/threonine-protein kinase RsbW
MTDDVRYHLSTVAVPACLDRLHAMLEAAWADHPDVGLSDRTLFEIAVTEVAGNIIEHTAAGEPLELGILVRVTAPHLKATFEDCGPAVGVALGSAELPDDLAESGRGIALALRAADEVVYWRDGATNRWRVVRRRTGA